MANKIFIIRNNHKSISNVVFRNDVRLKWSKIDFVPPLSSIFRKHKKQIVRETRRYKVLGRSSKFNALLLEKHRERNWSYKYPVRCSPSFMPDPFSEWKQKLRDYYIDFPSKFSTHRSNNSPANASCLIKKSILVFRRLPHRRPISTAMLPTTIIANSSHNTVNCSVCNKKTNFLENYHYNIRSIH